jgi:hypothetical protein
MLLRVFSILRSSCRVLFRRKRIDQDLDEEVRSHLALHLDCIGSRKTDRRGFEPFVKFSALWRGNTILLR